MNKQPRSAEPIIGSPQFNRVLGKLALVTMVATIGGSMAYRPVEHMLGGAMDAVNAPAREQAHDDQAFAHDHPMPVVKR